MRNLLTASLALLTAASAAFGAEIWVDASSRAPAPDGTKDAPFRTIAQALATVSPGDTVTVRAGTYYESVRVPGGAAGKPVTLRAAAGQRVIVSGAVPVRGWKPLAGGIYTTTLDFRPSRLQAGFAELTCAREPNEGWWAAAEGKDVTYRVAAANPLKALPAAFAGGQAYLWTRYGNTFFTVPVASVDRKGNSFTVVRASKWMKIGAGDRAVVDGKNRR